MAMQEGYVTFSSSKNIGKYDPKDMEEESDDEHMDDYGYTPMDPTFVTFSTSRDAGNVGLDNYEAMEGYLSFSTASVWGKLPESDDDDYQDEDDMYGGVKQVTFSTAKQVGKFDKLKTMGDSFWVWFSDASDEEDWAVMNATLLTFFLTMVFFLIIGVVLGKKCC